MSRKLPSNVPNVTIDDPDSDSDEFDDNVIDPNDEMFNYDKSTVQIEIKREEIDINDLEIMEFIITSLEKGTKLCYFVAQIQDKDIIRKQVVIDYLEKDEQHQDIFIKTEKISEKNYQVPIADVVMRLPDPVENRRGNKVYFPGNVNLNI